MATESSKRATYDGILLVFAIAFGIMAIMSELPFLSGSIACLALISYQRPAQQKLAMVVFALAVAYFFVVFGYGMGKDMAKRDNAVSASGESGKAARLK
jgi:ABC-type Na+ efflux pump permease subunit